MIIHGDVVKRIDMHYVERNVFELKITLEDAATGEESGYVSQDIDDAVLLRHIGVMKIDDLPIFEVFLRSERKPPSWATSGRSAPRIAGELSRGRGNLILIARRRNRRVGIPEIGRTYDLPDF